VAPDRATARHRKAIPAAPKGNIQRPPNPQILIWVELDDLTANRRR
jgi:hypothetical protein